MKVLKLTRKLLHDIGFGKLNLLENENDLTNLAILCGHFEASLSLVRADAGREESGSGPSVTAHLLSPNGVAWPWQCHGWCVRGQAS